MNAFSRFRLYHWLLAALFILAYLTGDDAGLLHLWLGYGLMAVLVWRVFALLFNWRGYPGLLPSRQGWLSVSGQSWGKILMLCMLALIGATSYTGITMVDNAQAIQQGLSRLIPAAQADELGEEGDGTGGLSGHDSEDVHEFFANATLAVIALHVLWLLAFRRRQVAGMLGMRDGMSVSVNGASDVPPNVDEDAGALVVVSIEHVTADAIRIGLQLPARWRERFAFRPGQYLTLRLPLPGGPVWRCYSLCGQPGSDVLAIVVKRTRVGAGSAWLHEHLRVGDRLAALPPAGCFYQGSGSGDMLMLAAGSGITPLYGMLIDALQQGTGQITLVYANKDPAHAIFHDDLLRLQQQYPDRFVLRFYYSAESGRLTPSQLEDLCRPARGRQVYICGPATFMQLARQCVLASGANPGHVQLESFTLASDVAGSGHASQLTVDLGGQLHHLEVAAGEVLLDAMQRHGVAAPAQCRMGVCGTCRCQLEAGKVVMPHHPALSDDEIATGWVLACQACAQSQVLSVRYGG